MPHHHGPTGCPLPAGRVTPAPTLLPERTATHHHTVGPQQTPPSKRGEGRSSNCGSGERGGVREGLMTSPPARKSREEGNTPTPQDKVHYRTAPEENGGRPFTPVRSQRSSAPNHFTKRRAPIWPPLAASDDSRCLRNKPDAEALAATDLACTRPTKPAATGSMPPKHIRPVRELRWH